MRRRHSAIAANPVLIGAATVLVAVVAVFLAYNANAGLPFVPTYELRAEVPSAANLVVGNEVRVGGTRIGSITRIRPLQREGGRVTAELTMELEERVRPMPIDTTVLIRPRSALGLKYVELRRGQSEEGFTTGSRMPLALARPAPVELDEVLNAFDDETRAAASENLDIYGSALAGRGRDINRFVGELGPLLEDLRPVMRNLADERTGLARFVRALGATADQVAPVAEAQASLLRNLDTTFGALAAVARPHLQDTITGTPPFLEEGVRSFPAQRPFLQNSERLLAELRPGMRALRTAAPTLASALEDGTPRLRRSIELSRRLEPTFGALERFAKDPMTRIGLGDLRELARLLSPITSDLAPVQTRCNYVSLFFRNVASLLSEGDRNGTGQRFTIIAAPQGPNSEGGPSKAPAAGPNDNFLHTNPYPNTPGGRRTAECEAGNEVFVPGRLRIGNVPGNQGTQTEVTTRPATGASR